MNRRQHLTLTGRLLAAAPLVAWAGAPLWLGGCTRRDTAPDFSYSLLDGSTHSSAALRGKVVLVNFWATSCSTCVHEMPQIMATHQKFSPQGFDTLAVAMSYDPPAYVDHFAKSRQLPFGVAIDNTGEIAKRFGEVRLTPTSFLIDKRGGIVKKYVGAPDFAALHQLIGDLIAEA
jgi:peroxiredoxin